MKNVTITLPDDVALKVRVEAAKAGLSVSAWFRQLAENAANDTLNQKAAQEKAFKRMLEGPSSEFGYNGKLPTREERNARR